MLIGADVFPAAIPRMSKWSKDPAGAIESPLSELEATLSLVSSESTNEEGLEVIEAVSQCGLALAGGADMKTKVGFNSRPAKG